MTRTIQIEVPINDLDFLKDLAKVRGWKTILKRQKKTGIQLGLEDIKKGNLFHAKDSEDLINQCLK